MCTVSRHPRHTDQSLLAWTLTWYDLTEALRTLGLGVRDGDIVTIVRKFDASQVGTFDYLELLSALRGDMSNERLKVVRERIRPVRCA